MEAWPLDWSGQAGEISLPVTMVSNNLEGRLCFAEQGLGITCLPEFTVRDGLASGRLQVVRPSGRDASPKVGALVDFLLQRMGG